MGESMFRRVGMRLTFSVIPRLVRGTYRRTGVDRVARTSRAMTMSEKPRRLVYCWALPECVMVTAQIYYESLGRAEDAFSDTACRRLDQVDAVRAALRAGAGLGTGVSMDQTPISRAL
jgi:hypothetical protein